MGIMELTVVNYRDTGEIFHESIGKYAGTFSVRHSGGGVDGYTRHARAGRSAFKNKSAETLLFKVL